jgi:site-specific DNA recombinase
MLRAVIYARYSSENQRDESIDAQVRLCKNYIKEKEYALTHIYADEAISGRTDDRAQFQQMLADAKNGLFDIVIVDAVDRFSRDKYDSALYKRELRKKCGVRIEYASQKIDDTPEGLMLEGILENLAQYYAANLARETMKGLTENALRGWHTGGIPPFGLKLVTHTQDDGTIYKTYDVHPDQAPVVRKIFEMYDAGATYGEIMSATKEDMIRLRGRPIAKNSIYDMLRNEKYTGTFVFNKGTKKEHKRTRPDVIRVPDAFPAIVSRELWERVQAKMDKRKRSHGERARGKAKEVYLLTGLIYCGKCGSAFIGNRNVGKTEKKRYAYYKCGLKDRSKECKAKTIRKEVVEQIVIDDIKQNIFSPKAKASLRKKFENYLQARPKSIEKRITQIKREIAGIDKIINNLIAAVELGKGSAVLIERLEIQEERKKELQNELFNLEAKKETPIEIGLVDELLEKAEKEFEKADDPQRVRQIIQLFVDKVVVHDDKVEVITKIKIPAGDNSDGDSGGTFWDTVGSPNGTRTRVSTLRGWCPRPLDDRAINGCGTRDRTWAR